MEKETMQRHPHGGKGKILCYINGNLRNTLSEYLIEEHESLDGTKNWWFNIQHSPMGFMISEFLREANGQDWLADIGRKQEYKYVDLILILKEHEFI